MSNKNFMTNYSNKKEYKGALLNTESKVETLGYIPHNVKIQNYINAGLNLAKARAEQYDADHMVKPEDILKNPFRDIGNDFSDIDREKKRIQKNIENTILKQKLALEREAKRQETLKKEGIETPQNKAPSVAEKPAETPTKT